MFTGFPWEYKQKKGFLEENNKFSREKKLKTRDSRPSDGFFLFATVSQVLSPVVGTLYGLALACEEKRMFSQRQPG